MADQISILLAENQVNAGSAVTATVNFRTRSSAAASTPTSVRYRVDCLTNGRQVIADTSISAASSASIVIPGPNNGTIDDSNDVEIRQLTVIADYGLDTQVKAAATWRVRNVRSYAFPHDFEDDERLEPYFPITEDEEAAPVDPDEINYRIFTTPIRDISRYVDDNIGATDESDAIQDAINVAAVRGGEIVVPEGTYLADSLIWKNGVHFSGTSNVIFKRNGTAAILTASTLLSGASLKNITFDANGSVTNPLIDLDGAVYDFRLEDPRGINFDNGTTACALVDILASASVANEKIRIIRPDCTNAVDATDNYQSIVIQNPRNVKILDGTFVNSGAIVLYTTTSFSGGDLGDCELTAYVRGVDSSAMLIRVNGAVTMDNVRAWGDFRDCCPTPASNLFEKFCITFQQATGTSGGTFRNLSGDGVFRNADVNCEGGVLVSCQDAAELHGVEIDGVYDFNKDDGTPHTTGNSTQRGIWVIGPTASPGTGVVITPKSIRGTQSGAIVFSDLIGYTIAPGSIVECLQDSSTGATEGAIWGAQGVIKNGSIKGGNILDCGAGGTSHAAIALASSSSVDGNNIDDFDIADTRGGGGMIYGVKVGAAAVNNRLGYDLNVTGFVTAAIDGNGINTIFASGDATPSVAARTRRYQTANATPTVITDFDDTVDGDDFFVLIADANTTLDFTGTNIRGNNGVDLPVNNADFLRVKVVGTTKYVSRHET